MSINRVRAIVLGFLALLAVGSFGATAAMAEAGPFWYHRNNPKEEGGFKIEKEPENFNGEGGQQILKGTISGTAFEIEAKSVQAKGIIYNNKLQGQIKVLLTYHEPKLVKPTITGCVVSIGNKNNEVKSAGHLMWKWDGTETQLKQQPQSEQKPDIVFTAEEIAESAEKLPEGSFTTITFSSTCGALTGTFKVNGSQSSLIEPTQLGTWSRKLTTRYPGWPKQHFWNGKKFVGVEPKLTFAGNAAELTGETTTTTETQEVAIFEK